MQESPKILVVDDEEHIQELIRFNLEKNGYKIICTANGIDAIKIAKEQLIKHYEKSIGAFHFGNRRMIINTRAAKILVNQYFNT